MSVNMSEVSPEVRDAVLKDPRVQEALRNAGEAALKDPKVQEQMVATCKEKFPDAVDKVKDWAHDPETQKKAKEYASAGLACVAAAPSQALHLIEQGPAGLRLLAFFGSLFSLVWASLTVINIIGKVLTLSLVDYLLAVYQVFFSLTTMLFEAKPEWVQKIPGLSRYQHILMEKCKFMTEVSGRGMFYVFQGTLWLARLGSVFDLLTLALGLYMIAIGVLHILMYFGIMPSEVATVVKRRLRHEDDLEAGTSVASSSGQARDALMVHR